jgi:4-nitrophenyl phosphatase
MNPAQSINALILDMDGVLWRENEPIGDLNAIFRGFYETGLNIILATNNATRTPPAWGASSRKTRSLTPPWASLIC